MPGLSEPGESRVFLHSWRNIAITLIDPDFGEQTAQAGEIACCRQLPVDCQIVRASACRFLLSCKPLRLRLRISENGVYLLHSQFEANAEFPPLKMALCG